MSAGKILVIDDEERVRDMIKFRLCLLGYEVVEATNGRDGLEAASREQPDLVLLDIMMPDVDGFQVCDRLKENEETREIPVVMLTAKGEAMDVARAYNCGAEDYVVKPYDPRVLHQKVAKNLRAAVDARA